MIWITCFHFFNEFSILQLEFSNCKIKPVLNVNHKEFLKLCILEKILVCLNQRNFFGSIFHLEFFKWKIKKKTILSWLKNENCVFLSKIRHKNVFHSLYKKQNKNPKYICLNLQTTFTLILHCLTVWMTLTFILKHSLLINLFYFIFFTDFIYFFTCFFLLLFTREIYTQLFNI